ncbi:NADH-quinone oxidoreductase subunit C [Paenibacillus sp. YN15]|uniref:NADH-quinone oxidoreductase subunit C n=1 Tax=Paenibacillus sp. YN15 TaxID=1742774 RepID=UPI000DCEB99F|nr:NADH-quinone oxidoreductase subunit C [Paenibacillus sp. YN15]RAV03143.1 NADH-quinone oxidoreductase subunit C [Paenibacillus sp. YN15]
MSDEIKEPSVEPPAAAEGGADEAAAKEAKAKAAAEARAARAAAREAAKKAEAGQEGGADAPPKAPSPKQPVLEGFVGILKEALGEAAVLEAFINERDDHIPCVVLDPAFMKEAAPLLHDHSGLGMNYLRSLAGSDLETHLEVIYHLLRLADMQELCIKVKLDRDAPSVASVTGVWRGADWYEREVFDLLGVDFPGHPNLVRIMLPDDWEGHPLRKDYEPLDPEV